MQTYLGFSGNNRCIMCKDYNEIYVFDFFGNFLSSNGLISSCSNWREVDVVSLVDNGVSGCEAFFNGSKMDTRTSLMNSVAKLRDYGGHITNMLTVPHEDSIGKYNQVLFVYKKGFMSSSILSRIFTT